MVILLRGKDKVITINPAQFKSFIDTAYLSSNNMEVLENVVSINRSRRYVYVSEGEWASLLPSGCVDVIGSDEATTCHILILRHVLSGRVGVIHLNGFSTCGMITALCNDITEEPNSSFETYLVGGFSDSKELSKKLSLEILDYMALSMQIFNINICAIEAMNTRHDVKSGLRFPRITGLAVCVKTGHVFSASFMDKGPNYDLRCCRMFLSAAVANSASSRSCFDANTNEFVISPIAYNLREFGDGYVESVLLLSDKEILRRFSTSPSQENSGFVGYIRQMLIYLASNNDYRKVFPGSGRLPRRYHLREILGQYQWVLTAELERK